MNPPSCAGPHEFLLGRFVLLWLWGLLLSFASDATFIVTLSIGETLSTTFTGVGLTLLLGFVKSLC